MSVLRLAFTPGDPAGIGLDLAIMLAQQAQSAEIVCFSNQYALYSRADELGLSIEITPFQADQRPEPNKARQIKLINHPIAEPPKAQKLSKNNAYFVLSTIEKAAMTCQNKQFDAMVTGPIHKGIINQAGIQFSGHTEFLQQTSGVTKVVMMLANQHMKVALATTHLPLSEVADHIKQNELVHTLKIIQHDFKNKFGIKKPHIVVAGLNPHAGEFGYLGNEEITIINPALDYCRQHFGMRITGALPADTLFNPKYLADADVVLVMYHDQGLPVIKYAGFGESINITLGLPFIRTSVDHGTALELAGTGDASTQSLKAAIAMAINLCQQDV